MLLSFLLFTSPAWCQEPNSLAPEDRVTPELYATGFVGNSGIIIDQAGNLYATNYRYEGTLGRISTDFKAEILKDLAASKPGETVTVDPTRLALDREGRILITDAATGRLLRVDPEDATTTVLAERTNGRHFTSLYGISIDRSGNIYFSEPTETEEGKPSGTIYKHSVATQKTTVLLTGIDTPTGIAISAEGDWISIAESGTGMIHMYDLKKQNSASPIDQALISSFDLKKLLELPEDSEAPRISDLVIDQKKQLYICLWDTGQVLVVDGTTGKRIRLYATGGKNISSCALYKGALYVSVPDKEAIFRLKINAPAAISSTP